MIMDLSGDVSLVTTADDNAGMACNPGDPVTCYGSATTATVQLSALVYYRLSKDWFTNASLGYGRQAITLAEGAQGPITSTTGYARLGYRF